MDTKVGYVGLGVMGGRMAENILKKGFKLVGYDIKSETLNQLVKKGAEPAASPADVAKRSDIIITCLPATKEVEEAVLGPAGIIEGIKPGSIYINMSTSSPLLTKRIAEIFKKKGADVLGAPVSGGPPKAGSGTLTIMVGGEKQVLERCRPVLEAMGSDIYLVGDVGAGETVKIVNNLLVGIFTTATAEALVLGVKAGVDPDMLVEVIGKSSGDSHILHRQIGQYALMGNFSKEDLFSVDYMRKDLQLALDLGKDLSVPMLFGGLAFQMYEFARAKGRASNYHPVVMTVLEDIVGVKVRSKDAKEKGGGGDK